MRKSHITTNPASLTVAENSGPTRIGITAPTDSIYSSVQLSVMVTGLPTDGVLLLSDGVTQVYKGEVLTVAQLIGLEFKPTAWMFGQSSTFSYKVSDPNGTTASGTATVAIKADTLPPTTTAVALTVAENSGPTAIGIAPPTDPNYASSQLSIAVTGLPTDGIVLLADGVTAVTAGETLTATQLAGLMFKPSTNLASVSSAFTYKVTDPSGLSATGTATLAIGAASVSVLTVDPDTLTVAENAAATPIGILAPTDSVYSASLLSVKVTAVPTDGMVLLADGVTAVTAGEALTVAQLTGLEFKPTANLASGSSSFAYSVTDPAGTSSSGSTTLVINPPTGGSSPDGSTILATASGSLTTSAGTFYFHATNPVSANQCIFLNGSYVGGIGATEMAVENQGNLYAYDGGLWYKWSGGSFAQTNDPNMPSPPQGSPPPPDTNVDTIPILPQPSQAGDIVDVRLQNTGTTTESAGYTTFGQVFLPGAVNPTDSLVARINGANYAVQMDVKSTNPDGSVRQAVLTVDAPSIAAGGTLDLMLAKGTALAPTSAAPSAATLLASGYNLSVNFSFHNPDGTTTTDSTSAAAVLRAALSAGTVQDWLSGPNVNEYIATGTVDGGKLKVEFDIRAYANGTTTTDVIFNNSWMFSPGKSDLNYDVAMSQGGQQVYSATGVQQYLYSLWDHQVASAGTISPNVQYDVPYLINTGAVPSYDTSYGVSDTAIQQDYNGLNATNTGPLGTAEVDTYMPGPGGRADIGPQPNWTAQWLLSQSASAQQVMMADANAAGGIPWTYTDENTGEPINSQAYSNFIQGENYPGFLQPTNGWPTYSTTGGPTGDGNPWAPDAAHMPDLNYLTYLTSGSYYQLQLLQAQADYAITSHWGSNDSTGTVPLGFVSSFNGNGNQTRGIAWELRQVAEAAYLTPNTDPLKTYFTSELDVAMNGLVQEYIVDNFNGQYGQLNGFIEGSSGPNAGQVTPYEEDLVVTTLAEVAGMNIPQASADAVQMLQYMNNFVAGVFTNGANGFNPLDGTAYWMNVNLSTDPNNPYTTPTTMGAPITTWSQLFSVNVANGILQANPTELIQWPTALNGGYGPVAKAALADEITYTESPQAIQAYGFVVSQVAYAFALAGQNEAAGYQQFPEFSIVPRLPDGVWLQNSQMQIDTSGASMVSLTATGGDSLLAVVGSGTATLTGGAGATDLLYGGSGPTTLKAGTGNDYLFGGSGSTTFVDNTGNDYMHGGSGANTYVFAENHSGHDAIANFNPATDHLKVGANLDGNGITSASQLIAGATVTNGNTVLHLSPNDDITLLGINQPSSLLSSILVS